MGLDQTLMVIYLLTIFEKRTVGALSRRTEMSSIDEQSLKRKDRRGLRRE